MFYYSSLTNNGLAQIASRYEETRSIRIISLRWPPSSFPSVPTLHP
jgi:hypothetical protein